MRAAFNSRADSDPPCPQIVKASEEFEAELVTNDKHNELINDGELEELDSGLKPSASELPAAINLYRVIRAGGKCNPPGITDDVCEPGTGTKCLPVPEQGIKRCIKPASRIPAGGACTAGDVCVDRYNCIGRMCVIKYNGYCSARDICEIGYTCVDGRCGVQPARRTVVPAGGACAAGDVCVDRYNCIGGMCVIKYDGYCSARDICEIGYSCVDGRCGAQPARRNVVPAGGACAAGDVCVDRYNCIGGMCVIRYNGYCSVGDICEIGYTCVDGKCGTGSTSVICGVNSADCASGYICCGGDCVIAPTGTCSVNCICYNNDCGACNANCNCFGKCYMPNCGTNCNYNGGASYCSPGLAVTEKNEGGFIVEG